MKLDKNLLAPTYCPCCNNDKIHVVVVNNYAVKVECSNSACELYRGY